jgi:hypothetical protein
MARSRTIWKDGQLFAEYVNDELVWLNPNYRAPARSALKAPMVMRDMGEYVSTLDGAHITSRSQHREHMRKHDVIEVGNERLKGMPEPPRTTNRELGEAIKRRIDEVAAMPQAQYDAHVQTQAAEHQAIGGLVTAS